MSTADELKAYRSKHIIRENIGITKRTFRGWKATFKKIANDNTFPDSLQGKYGRTRTLLEGRMFKLCGILLC